MTPLCGSVATLAVASIYCIWNAYSRLHLQPRRLAHGIAQLLWAMAQQPE